MLLDEIDGDENLEDEPDLEDGFDREQDLGSTNAPDQTRAWQSDASGDGTLEFEGDGVAECDRENSVAEDFARLHDQTAAWGPYGAGAVADDHEGTGDDEPSLGSVSIRDDQTGWSLYGTSDVEADPAENGIGDLDGLIEQHLGRYFNGAAI